MRVALFALFFALLLFGCLQPTPSPTVRPVVTLIPTEAPTTVPTLAPTLAPTPTPAPVIQQEWFEVVEPASGSVVAGPIVLLKLNSSVYSIGVVGGSNSQLQGHFCVFVDDRDCERVVSFNYGIGNLSVGRHKVKVQLVNNDRSPFKLASGAVDPASFKEVSFTVLPPEPFTVTSPAEGEAVFGSTVVVKTRSTQYKLGFLSNNTPGEGHFLLYLDDNKPVTANVFDYQLQNIPPGDHVLRVQFVNNDGTPLKLSNGSLDSSFVKQVRFTTKQFPSFVVIEPADGAMVTGSRVGVKLTSKRFKIGFTPANVQGEGVFLFSLDGGQQFTVRSFEYSIPNVSPGRHSLRIQLANNDGTPLKLSNGAVDPETIKEVSFNTTTT